MQMISQGSARASRVDRGALAPVGARNCSLRWWGLHTPDADGEGVVRSTRGARAPQCD